VSLQDIEQTGREEPSIPGSTNSRKRAQEKGAAKFIVAASPAKGIKGNAASSTLSIM